MMVILTLFSYKFLPKHIFYFYTFPNRHFALLCLESHKLPVSVSSNTAPVLVFQAAAGTLAAESED